MPGPLINRWTNGALSAGARITSGLIRRGVAAKVDLVE